MDDTTLRAKVEAILAACEVEESPDDGPTLVYTDCKAAASALVALFGPIVRAAMAAEAHLAPDWESNEDRESFMRCGGCANTGWGQADIDHDDDCPYLMLGLALRCSPHPTITPPADR